MALGGSGVSSCGTDNRSAGIVIDFLSHLHDHIVDDHRGNKVGTVGAVSAARFHSQGVKHRG